uniref:Uncharacterized protein n=1 Tax=Arundo donax TaxID=35708 RepID=A0A0A8XU04_ARUDO
MRSNLVRIFCLCYAVMIKRFPIMDICELRGFLSSF